MVCISRTYMNVIWVPSSVLFVQMLRKLWYADGWGSLGKAYKWPFLRRLLEIDAGKQGKLLLSVWD